MLHVNKCVQEVTPVFNWLLAIIKSKNDEQILDSEELGNEKQGYQGEQAPFRSFSVPSPPPPSLILNFVISLVRSENPYVLIVGESMWYSHLGLRIHRRAQSPYKLLFLIRLHLFTSMRSHI